MMLLFTSVGWIDKDAFKGEKNGSQDHLLVVCFLFWSWRKSIALWQISMYQLACMDTLANAIAATYNDAIVATYNDAIVASYNDAIVAS